MTFTFASVPPPHDSVERPEYDAFRALASFPASRSSIERVNKKVTCLVWLSPNDPNEPDMAFLNPPPSRRESLKAALSRQLPGLQIDASGSRWIIVGTTSDVQKARELANEKQ
ncbi:MAG: hypothetical protein KDB14_31150 [Planctomycetales bacterium]|nr:hypothetical protein [Planctomycetales bacterium]